MEALNISVSDAWHKGHPGAVIGVLEMKGATIQDENRNLAGPKREIEEGLRERYGGLSRKDLLSEPVMAAYERYYRRFNKTYHVLLHVESIAFKGWSLPEVLPLVEANFMVEVVTRVMTAGHDAQALAGRILFDCSQAEERMTLMNGTEIKGG